MAVIPICHVTRVSMTNNRDQRENKERNGRKYSRREKRREKKNLEREIDVY